MISYSILSSFALYSTRTTHACEPTIKIVPSALKLYDYGLSPRDVVWAYIYLTKKKRSMIIFKKK